VTSNETEPVDRVSALLELSRRLHQVLLHCSISSLLALGCMSSAVPAHAVLLLGQILLQLCSGTKQWDDWSFIGAIGLHAKLSANVISY